MKSQTTKMSRLSSKGMMDWTALLGCLALLAASILLLLNGTCSRPHSLSAEQAVCVGGQLSVQSWLAIVGVEFTFLSTILLPRLVRLLISKYFTSHLTSDGVSFLTLL